MMVTIDDETLARAVLTFCLDSADAMMYALVKGTGSAASALQLIADSGPGNHENVTAAACTSLDAAFINGVTRWGRTINARGTRGTVLRIIDQLTVHGGVEIVIEV